ncbi:MAG: ABC transporter ATP-binding protein [Planctomycetes bacterium]|nr:ABC transporter ATP-binding protein [Planctomycetota bacterium]
METATVEIDNVTKRFDDLIAVDRISLCIDRGQTLGLIGPNGAGKTTLLRIIASLAVPDRGDVRIQGQSVRTNPRAVRKILGFMPAEFGCPRNLTIGEYLEYFGCLYAIPKLDRRQRIQEVCQLTDLSGRERVLVKGLSTGNRQRLLLAKTLLHDPQVLVLDEPASGLDPRARTELRGIVRELAAMGKTIIISSHILPDIEDISDRIGIIEAGRLVLDGNLDALRAHHRTSSRQVKLRVGSEDATRARNLLAALSVVTSCELQEPFLIIGSDEPNRNFVLAEMLKHDIRVLQFQEDEPSLEEIFMQSTAGKVT